MNTHVAWAGAIGWLIAVAAVAYILASRPTVQDWKQVAAFEDYVVAAADTNVEIAKETKGMIREWQKWVGAELKVQAVCKRK